MVPTTFASPDIDRGQILKAAATMGFLGAGAHAGPRLMAILCNPGVSEREVVSLIKKEPAIYARMLRVANSPYYGQTRSISTIERALPVLGLEGVRGIAAAACLDRATVLGNPRGSVDMKALVNHSVAAAAAADSLAHIRHHALAADAFIASLLHNLGVVIQMQLDAPGIEAIIAARRTEPTRDIRTLELECAAVGHEECIAVVFEAWQLPDSLVAAVRHHHAPMGASETHRSMAALVNLGANLSLAGGNTCSLEPAPVERDALAMAQLELGEEDLKGVVVELPERTAELRGTLLVA